MQLPNKENAIIPIAKIKDYLLSDTHPSGKSKSKFFRMFGFNETNIPLLEQFLLKIAQSYEVKKVELSPHGKKYTIDGKLYAPVGKNVSVRTIWIIENNKDRPRFVTAYPN